MLSTKRFASRLLLALLIASSALASRDALARPDSPASRGAEPRIALVIGNAKYTAEMTLANPANDARLIGATLKSLGFDVILVTDAAQKPMQRAIVDFGERLAKAGPDATGLFYYAGHGLQVEGDNYLVPVDAEIARAADVEIDAVRADLVLKQMAYAGSRVNIVILDACRNNPLERDFRSVADGSDWNGGGFAEIRVKPKGTFIAYSTAPGEVAVDGTGDHSPFAAALAQAMQQPGFDLPEVFQRVREKVLDATDQRQTPWDSSSLVKSFYFMPPSPDAGATLLAAAEPSPASSSAIEEPAPLVRTADAAFEPAERTLFARAGSRLRAAPDTGAPIVSKPALNAELHAVAQSADGAWWQVATATGETAYVHRQAVSESRVAAAAIRLPATTPISARTQHATPAQTAGRAPATGIGVVDTALGWLAEASKSPAPSGATIRATR